MIKYALFARFEAKPGKEAAVAEFLQQGLALSKDEPLTRHWFALKLSDRVFGVFDTFESEDGRQAHLTGKIAQALMANAPELFTGAPTIERIDILGAKA
jgi:quinol monooxygenase YgiN